MTRLDTLRSLLERVETAADPSPEFDALLAEAEIIECFWGKIEQIDLSIETSSSGEFAATISCRRHFSGAAASKRAAIVKALLSVLIAREASHD